jgi:hypothetical protein
MHKSLTVITQSRPGLFDRSELSAYLNVGQNELKSIAVRFGLVPIDGHYPERRVWRQILEVEPSSEEGAALLRVGLVDIDWVAKWLGKATSTIRNRIAEGTFRYSTGVQLGNAEEGRHARLRRWCAPRFLAELEGHEPECLRSVPRLTLAETPVGLPDLPEIAASTPCESITAELTQKRWK